MTDRKDKDNTTRGDILSDETYFARPKRERPSDAEPSVPETVTDEDAPRAPGTRGYADASEKAPSSAKRGGHASERAASAADKPKRAKSAAPIDLFADDEDELPADGADSMPADDADDTPAAAPLIEPVQDESLAARLARRLTNGKTPLFRKPGKKQLYGKRTNAERARTVFVTNETAATREMIEARKRAAVREEQRQQILMREEKMRQLARTERMQKNLSILFTCIIVAIIAAAVFYFAFLVSRIEVSGELTRYSPNDIVLKSGLRTKKHILEQSLDDAEAKLDADPYLDASVRYVFPNRIRITVTERRQAAAVRWGPNGEYLAIIDSDGIVLESDVANSEGLLLVEGMVITGANKAQRIGEVIDEQVSAMLTMINKLQEYGLSSKISYLDMAETMSIGMYTSDGYRVEVGGLEDLDVKLTRLNNKWTPIMNAAQQYALTGSTTVTIYLYAKMGVTVSPYAPDYVAVQATPDTIIPNTSEGATPDPNASADPNATADPNASADPNATPAATDPYYTPVTPSPSPAPFGSDPFTG